MALRWRFLLFWLVLLLAAFKPETQLIPGQVTLTVDAGFDGSFRENQWMPVYILAANDSSDVEGRLVVRPATSDNAVSNTFSVPISLPQGARKAVFLYITAQSFASQIRVEFIDSDGVVVAAQTAPLRAIQSRDQLYVVVTDSATGSSDLTGVHDAGYGGYQANWRVENIPDNPASLASVNMMLFSDLDSGQLTSLQQNAIRDWVIQGGHLIVTGGPTWQATAAGLGDLLPLSPDDSQTVNDLAPIADWLRFTEGNFSGRAIVSTGELLPEVEILVTTPDDIPLIIRRTLGSGTVDYLAADPNTAPLRGWSGTTDLWLALASTVRSQPSWTYGVNNWEAATTSVNVLPGINLLPDILPLFGFLALYIVLIGPLNYLVLSRLNRRELAWVSIPILIVLFSVLAWVVGFNLRGNEVTLSRLALVESWPDTDRARVQQFVGLLSPRRAQYSLNVSDNSLLRPIPQLNQSSFLRAGVQSSTDIQQTDMFRADAFSVDASFIAAFDANTIVEKPAISGQASMINDQIEGQQVMRGSVRNDTDQTLQNPVLLVRGQAYELGQSLIPGEVSTFDLVLAGEGLPSPTPMAYPSGEFSSIYYRSSYYYQNFIDQSIKDVMGERLLNVRNFFIQTDVGAAQQQETYRRQMFLTSVISDPYEVLTGRGDGAYLAGWTNASPLDVSLEGGNWKSLDTTLYIVELEVSVIPPAGQTVISPDRFTWFVRDHTGLTDVSPVNMTLQSGDQAVFRFTPLPDAVLREVEELTIIIDHTSNSNRTVPLLLWNWEDNEWEDITITDGNSYSIRDPERFLGPENAVEVQVSADAGGTFGRVQDVSIEHRGRF